MAKLPEEKRNAFSAAYRFYEAHWDMPDTEEAWTECARDMAQIATEHKNTELITEFLMACFQVIDLENRAARRLINEPD